MRHRIKGRKLNRTASHRKSLIRNLANQLFEHKEIKTTTAKAKEARVTVERLITYAKKGDTHHRRLAFSFLRQKDTIKTLFDEIAPTFEDRQGGYTRVIKLGRRQGDGAPMAILQLVGFETLADTSKPEKKKPKRKEEKAAEKETKVVDKKETDLEKTPAEDIEEATEDLKEVVEEKTAEEPKKVEEEKLVDEPEQVEEKRPVDKPEKVEEEEPVKDETAEKAAEEPKTDDSEPDEKKKEK